ncbi:MAG: Flp pilus assembly complex ATPase component TadA [Coriobacteriia bacterium]|nr:Flp pilus assembly complex ATPase component TadA [Coriobacteriia bacterium]
MSPGSGISRRVLDGLVEAGLMTAEQAGGVVDAARAAGTHEGTILTERAYVSPFDVMSVLEHEMGVPQVDLASYAPEDDALALVSASVARSYRALPLFEIEGMLTVAVGDPMDVFGLDAVSGLIGLEVEAVLADPVSVDNALDQYYGAAADATAEGPSTPLAPGGISGDGEVVEASDFFDEPLDQTPAVPVAPVEDSAPVEAPVAISETMEQMAAEQTARSGPAAIDLDVLAVADTRKVAVLVADILDHAVARGASRIHLLPYKDDFFLVYRIKGGLEKIASAPLSMQGGLVEGFKQFAHLGGVPATRPALGRVHTHIGDKDLVLTVSVVPTISGQRLVVSLSAFKPQPRGLEELGVSDAEARALRAMVERGRGILLVCAPVAGGASATYYALLAHAASAGKTVYSVEQSIEHEIPAVAQVMIEPGGLSSAAYIAAGMRQDTDVIAVDGLRGVEDVHLAVEAAGMGKLVVATFPAADIASGVWRMLELGAEPHSLAAALTLGVGQRLVRLNCPNCSMETDGQLASRIPGAPVGLHDKAGTGCPNCGKSGFRGATAIHEVLPFTEPVRAVVGRATGAADISAAAAAAGMRPLAAAGLSRVKTGEVSAEELNRVLRFTG